MKTLFIDSDIMLDVTLFRQPFFLHASNLFELINQKQFKAITSTVAFINTGYFLNKFNPALQIQSLKKLRAGISIIEVNENMIDLALQSNFTDFEDAVQYYAAKSGGADFIITRNIKDYKQATIPVLTAEQYLSTLY